MRSRRHLILITPEDLDLIRGALKVLGEVNEELDDEDSIAEAKHIADLLNRLSKGI